MIADTRRVKVLVADNHPMFRMGVSQALSAYPEVEIVGEAADGVSALDKIRSFRPDIAIVDCTMRSGCGAHVATVVAREGLNTKILILSLSQSGKSAYQAILNGASGFLTKNIQPGELRKAVIACARGEAVLPPDVTAGLVGEMRRNHIAQEMQLTPREHEVLSKIAAGMSIPEIAKHLYLAPTTVKSHVQRVYEKLGVSSRGAVVAEAMRRGLLD
ncbi:response regulator [Streptomyces sp. NRRL F-2664]|uniref:response regulator n=1 Tax=Streptomyces sp. NRRL F-2664 TaxID=1463842 RepID=UPI0018FE534A|nr:response regulator transcription factor [Streptomyces sp. NRRL F-2664]